MGDTLRGKSAIVGAAEVVVSRSEVDMLELYVQLAKAAIADSGIDKSEIDGVFITSSAKLQQPPVYACMLAEYLGIYPCFSRTLPYGGMSPQSTVQLAGAAIANGMAKTILVASAEDLVRRLGGRNGVFELYAGSLFQRDFELPYGPSLIAGYAMAASRHMHVYGTTKEQLATVPVTMRKHGSLHPHALIPKLVTVEDVLSSRMIASPFHILECAMLNDGGAAFIMTTAERARDCRKKPVYLLGSGESATNQFIGQTPDILTLSAKYSGETAFRMAGLQRSDIDLAFIYDNFAIYPLLLLEALGFCKPGESGPFIAEGNIGIGGKLPVNTHGGQMSHSGPGLPSTFMSLHELVMQLRGEAGPRQVKNANHAIIVGPSGVQATHGVNIFGREV